mgnify:CR=1 FL=1
MTENTTGKPRRKEPVRIFTQTYRDVKESGARIEGVDSLADLVLTDQVSNSCFYHDYNADLTRDLCYGLIRKAEELDAKYVFGLTYEFKTLSGGSFIGIVSGDAYKINKGEQK